MIIVIRHFGSVYVEKKEHISNIDVPNLHDKYHTTLYKDFVFIEENVKKMTIHRTKLLLLMLTTQI